MTDRQRKGKTGRQRTGMTDRRRTRRTHFELGQTLAAEGVSTGQDAGTAEELSTQVAGERRMPGVAVVTGEAALRRLHRHPLLAHALGCQRHGRHGFLTVRRCSLGVRTMAVLTSASLPCRRHFAPSGGIKAVALVTGILGEVGPALLRVGPRSTRTGVWRQVSVDVTVGRRRHSG